MPLEKVIPKLKAEISDAESAFHPAPQAVAPEQLGNWSDPSPQVTLWPGFTVPNEMEMFQDSYNTAPPSIDYSSPDFFSSINFVNPLNASSTQPAYRNAIPMLGAGPSLPTTVSIDPQKLNLRPDVSHLCRIRLP